MKTIEKIHTIETKYNVYVANDGKEFCDFEECKKYEESAKGVLNVKYKELIVGETTEQRLTGTGCEDNIVDILKIKNAKDADVIMQMYFFEHSGIADDYDKGNEYCVNLVNGMKETLRQAQKDKDYLFIGRGYEGDCFWFIGTRHSLIEGIEVAIEKAMEENNG